MDWGGFGFPPGHIGVAARMMAVVVVVEVVIVPGGFRVREERPAGKPEPQPTKPTEQGLFLTGSVLGRNTLIVGTYQTPHTHPGVSV